MNDSDDDVSSYSYFLSKNILLLTGCMQEEATEKMVRLNSQRLVTSHTRYSNRKILNLAIDS